MWVQATAIQAVWRGDFTAAASLIAEADAITEATGSGFARYATVVLAGFRGAEAEARPLVDGMINDAQANGQGEGIQWSLWVSAVLDNGLGRYESALAGAQQASKQAPELFVSTWALIELIEAGSGLARPGWPPTRSSGWPRPPASARPTGARGPTPAPGRCCSMAKKAEDSYREAIGRLSRTQLRPELARAHLHLTSQDRRLGRRATTKR